MLKKTTDSSGSLVRIRMPTGPPRTESIAWIERTFAKSTANDFANAPPRFIMGPRIVRLMCSSSIVRSTRIEFTLFGPRQIPPTKSATSGFR